MGGLTVNGIASVEKTQNERAEALKTLTSKPYNPNDELQQDALRWYMNNFEFHLNQMYLFQGLSTGLTAWVASWGAAIFLPIPQWVNYGLSVFLYCGAAGYILQNFKMTDFHQQLIEMKTIYNWCLKRNKTEYDGTETTTILSNPDIQRLIKLIAPLCTTEFIVVWDKVTEEKENKGIISSAFSYTHFLFSKTKPNVNLNRLHDLKVSVERREMDVGVFKGMEGAIHYFATDTHFKELLMTKFQTITEQSMNSIKSMLPGLLSSMHAKST